MTSASSEPATPPDARSALSIAITYPVVLSFVMGLVVLLMGALTTAGMQRSTRDLLDQLIHQVTERMRLAVVDSLETPHRVSGLIADGVTSGRLQFRNLADLESFIPRAAEIGRNLRAAAARRGLPLRALSVVSRGDSTLRGHYPAETNALAEGPI